MSHLSGILMIQLHGADYEAVGDSMLLRLWKFSRKDYPSPPPIHVREWGCCKSGQTIAELLSRLELVRHRRQIGPNVVVMIGTNDLLRTRHDLLDVDALQQGMVRVITLLQEAGARNIIVLTLPPIARFVYTMNTFRVWKILNRWIMSNEGVAREGVTWCNAGKIFFDWQRRRYVHHLFVPVFPAGRTDMVHWNEKGMELVLQLLRRTLARRH